MYAKNFINPEVYSKFQNFPNSIPNDYEVWQKGFENWDIGLINYGALTILIIITLLAFLLLVKAIFADNKKNLINSIQKHHIILI